MSLLLLNTSVYGVSQEQPRNHSSYQNQEILY